MDIKDAALKYLAPRARTGGEVKTHLKAKGFHEEDIQQVMEYLKDMHYVDDTQYCSQYLEYAFGKGKGVLRVKRELEEKGVSREVIEIALEDHEWQDTELQRAEAQAEKAAQGRTADQKLAGKIGRRLASLGYSSDVIYLVVGKYMRNQDE